MPAAPETDPSVLRDPRFLLFWSSRVMSSVAGQMQTVALGWLVYTLTGSPLDLGIIGLMQFLPLVCLTLLVGHVVDRYDRRTVLCACRAAAALAACGLAAGSAGGWIDQRGIFALVAVAGSARAFEGPTVSAMLPSLVSAGQLPRAIAITSSATQIAQIAGPALGGLLFLVGPAVAFGAPAALFAAAGLGASLLPARPPAPTGRALSLDSVLSGVRFIAANRGVLGAISLDLFAVLLGGATALLPIYARDILHVGSAGLGLLQAMPAAGAMAMAALLARFPLTAGLGFKLFVAVFVYGVATVAFAFQTRFPLACGALLAVGAADVVSVVIRSLLVQLLTPDAMRGRVNAIDSMFTGTSNQLGQFESGLVAAWFGTVASVVIGGAGSILVALLWMRLFPEIRRIDTIKPETG